MPSASKKMFKIRDPIYGFIELDEQEQEIINNPYFQRLRRIKQLSLTDMIYPGASHTRFEHSLGVMQMVTDMFNNIIKDENNFVKLNMGKGSDERTRKIIRLAALLHDIGHSPFSHAGENTMPPLPEGHSRYKTGEEKYEHEDYSISAIKFLFKDIIEDHALVENLGIKVEDVTALLGDNATKIRKNTLIWKELLSGQVDADRADYLLRDSLHLGVSYGIFDRNRLVHSITLGETETNSLSLSIAEGGLHIAESLVIARYQMFSQVYFHKTRRVFDYHVGNALKEVLCFYGVENGIFPAPENKENITKYLDFDDWKINGALKDGHGGKHGDCIIHRRPFKCVKKWEDKPANEDEIKDLRDKYAGKETYFDKDVSTKWYKLDKDILIYDCKDNLTYPLSFKSSIVKAMGQPRISRFYAER